MKKNVLAVALAALLPVSAIFAVGENKNENIVQPTTQNVEFAISKTTYGESVVPAADATGAPYNSLNVEIGLSKLKLFGYAQSTYYYKRAAGVDQNALDIQRVILMADAQLTPRFGFFLMYDAVKSEMHEYYAQYEFARFAKVRVGQYKQPFTLESILSPTYLSTIQFDPSVLYLAGIASDPLMGNHVARDAGVMLTGDFLSNGERDLFNYSIGVFNGPGMNQKENNNQQDVAGMLQYKPTKNLLLEGSFIVGTGHAQAPSPYGLFPAGYNYSRHRWNVGVEAKFSPLYLRAEYIQGYDGGVHSRGGYVNMLYTLFKNCDLILNWDNLDKNTHTSRAAQQALYDASGFVTRLNTYTAGMQWWFHKRCRLQGQFIYTKPRVGQISREFITQLQMVF
ncbi:MAG: hypothetical protein IKM47_06325 [Bacteroidaceae bacterium]|nr:hypothetical protein [Bacteroidaceae bacterium]